MTQDNLPDWYPAFVQDLADRPAASQAEMIQRAHRWGERAGIRRAVDECDTEIDACGRGEGVRQKRGGLEELSRRLRGLLKGIPE